MPEIVPILEFIHLLNAEGYSADYFQAVSQPAAWWAKVSEESRAQFLAARQADGTAKDVESVRVVVRRGKPDAIENVFVILDFGTGSAIPRAALRARNRVMYRAFQTPTATDHVEALPVPAAVFVEAGVGPGHGSTIALVDRVWGGDAYDVHRDGPLCEAVVPAGYRMVEEYWLDEPFTAAMILESEDHELVYTLIEPKLTALEQALLVTINDRLRDVLILEAEEPGARSAFMLRKLFDLLGMYRYHTDRRTAYKLAYYFTRNYLGLARIEPVMRDGNVEDVSCNGPTLPVFIAHSKYQSIRTNIKFDELELNSFTMKMAQRGGKLLSIAQPLVDASLPGGSRLQATLGTEVTSHGSAFTIRKFRDDPLTAIDLIRMGTHSLDTMATLWLGVETRRSIIVMGATASGKTTTLNAISQFIQPTLKIVSIEDTREITLQHENWLAAVTRDSNTGSAADKISMFDLLKAALRQRPDYLLVGEVRGAEGLTLFQAMSTGHTCFSTMHAGTVENAVYRLENPPIGVPRVMLTSLDFLVTQGQVDVNGRPGRRMVSMTEINGLDPQSRNVRINELYRWDAAGDAHQSVGTSTVFDRARQKAGWTRSRLDEEFTARRRVLQKLLDRNERHYSHVARAVRRFYNDRAESHPLGGSIAEGVPVPGLHIPKPTRLDPKKSSSQAADFEFEVVEGD